jgi:hypothetical protein
MREAITDILEELEWAVEDPDRADQVKKNLLHLKAILTPSNFNIVGAGNSQTYSFSHGAGDENEHRFLIEGFKSMLQSLIDSRLPNIVSQQNSDEANTLWAQHYMHRILEHAGLGDPAIYKSRSFIHNENPSFTDSIIYLASDIWITYIEHGYKSTVSNELFGVHYSRPSKRDLFNDIIKDCKEHVLKYESMKEMVLSANLLLEKDREENLNRLSRIVRFYDKLGQWAKDEMTKLKNQTKQTDQ